MTGAGILRAREALTAILASLQAGDRFTVLTSGGAESPALTIGGPNDAIALQAVHALAVDGGSDFGGGVVRAYQTATDVFENGGTNRVVLITDGAVAYPSVDFGLIASKADVPGIGVVGVGVGAATSYDDTLLATATEAGQGYDLFLDQPGEADVMLRQRFEEVMTVAARDVTVTITMPNLFTLTTPVALPPVGGSSPTGAPPSTDLSPGRALVYRGVLRACSPAVLQSQGQIQVDVSYTPNGSTSTMHAPLVTLPILHGAPPAQVLKANAILAFADALKGGDMPRWLNASTLANAAAFDADPDFTDPNVGIRQLLVQEQTLLH
jgi:hypothetical protein